MKQVIIGAGAAGIKAAQTIRSLDSACEIVVISRDDQIHSRCMLHKYLSGERNEKEINFVPEDFFQSNRIQWLKGKAITSLNCAEQRVKLDDGSMVAYDNLLLATGAYYLMPPIPGFREAGNVFGFRDLSDAQAIDRMAKPGRQVVIVGSGLVGMDAAYALMERGISPVVVEMANRIIPLQLDFTGANAYQKLFEQHGCQFRLASKAADTRRDEEGQIRAVVLDNGEELACDFVIVAAGVKPEVRFLENCGVETERSIKVDEYLRTTVPHVYAAGDVSGLSAIWPNAMKQGMTAAKNMCGDHARYDDTYAMKNTMNFFGLASLCIGDINHMGDHTEMVTAEDRKNYKKALVEHGRLQSILLQGDISGSGIYQYLIKNQIPLPVDGKDIFKLSFAEFYDFDGETGKYIWNDGSGCLNRDYFS